MKTLALIVFVSLFWTSVVPGRADSVQDFVASLKPASAGSYTRGDVYAHDLYRQLTDHGIHAVLIYFNWGNSNPQENQAAFVVYQDEHGRYWGKQSIGGSKWVSGTTPLEWTQSFYSDKAVSIFAVARPVQTVVAAQ